MRPKTTRRQTAKKLTRAQEERKIIEDAAKDETVRTCVLMFRRMHHDDQVIASHLAYSLRGRELLIHALQRIYREDLAELKRLLKNP